MWYENWSPRSDGREPADHDYVRSIVGRCVRCQRPLADHPSLKPQEEREEGVCPVNHSTVNIRFLIGDGGAEWTRCPGCNTQLEPSFERTGPSGPAYGPGRGALAPRVQQRLVAWRGWVQFNGGD